MTFTPTRLARATALVGGLMAGALAHADVSNGNFAAGLAGWQTFGDATALGSSPASLSLPITGSTLVLSNASLDADDYPLADGHYNVSGNAAGAAGVPAGLEDFVGAPIGSLDPDPVNHTSVLWEGSAAKQSFTVQAGDTLSFTWNLLSADRYNADPAFVAINTAANGLQVLALGNAAQATNAVSGDANLLQTGVHSFSYTFANAGNVTLSLAVADLDAPDGSSLLLVNNVALTAAAVPEPSSAILALLALGTGAVSLRRRAR